VTRTHAVPNSALSEDCNRTGTEDDFLHY